MRATVGLLALGTALLTSCATVEKAYIPKKMGNLEDSQASGGIRMSLVPDHYQAKIGDLLTFSIVLKNVSTEPIWIPKEPEFLLTWVYPDGKRDNMIRDLETNKTYTRANAVLLQPGQEKIYRSVITTYYFNRQGITEFRALVSVDKPASSDLNPFWNGYAESNGYGVYLKE
ncbi:MAG: hypothetical protein V1929_12800 [bacterium]